VKDLHSRNYLRVSSVFVCVIGLAFYLVPLQRRFAVLDDYRKVLEVSDGIRLFNVHRGMSGTLWNTGRVVPALLSGIVWRIATGVSQLSFMRFIALVAVLVSLVALIQLLRLCDFPDEVGIHLLAATVLGFVSLLLLPSVAATVTFATLAVPMVSVPVAIVAGLLLSTSRLTLQQILGSSLLILCSVFSYQQMAVLATLPVFFSVALHYSSGWDRRQSLKRGALVVGLIGVSLAANLAFIRVVSDDTLSRVASASISDKARRLVTSYIPKSFHLFLEKDPAFFAVSLAMFVVISVVSIALWRTAVLLIIAVFSSFAVSSILFLGTDGDTSYRVVFPSQLILWAGLVLVFVASMVNVKNVGGTHSIGIALVPFVLFGLLAIHGHDIAYVRISAANESDLERLECHIVGSYDAISASETVILQLAPVELTGPRGVHSEIGLLGSHVDWVASDMWKVVTSLDSRFSDFEDTEVSIVSAAEAVVVSDTSVILDLATTC
jgi:hypothetical protein